MKIERTDWRDYLLVDGETVDGIWAKVDQVTDALNKWPAAQVSTMKALKRDERGTVVGEEEVLRYETIGEYIESELTSDPPEIMICNSMEWAAEWYECEQDEARSLLDQLQRDIMGAFPGVTLRDAEHGYHAWNGKGGFSHKWGVVGVWGKMSDAGWKKLEDIIDRNRKAID